MFVRLATVLAVGFAALSASAQTMSALQPFVSSTPLIKRPQVVEELYSGVQARLQNVEPGLQVDFVMEEIDAKMSELMRCLEMPTLTIDDKTDMICATHFLLSDTLIITSFKPDSVVLKSVWDSVWTKVFSESDTTKKSARVILDSLLSVRLKAWTWSDDADPNDLSVAGDALREALKEIIPNGSRELDSLATDLNNWLFSELKRSIGARLKEIPAFDDTLYVADAVSQLNEWMADIGGRLREPIEDGVQEARTEMLKSVNSMSNWMVAGNLGLAVAKIGEKGSETNSSALAGISISFAWWPKERYDDLKSDISEFDAEIAKYDTSKLIAKKDSHNAELRTLESLNAKSDAKIAQRKSELDKKIKKMTKEIEKNSKEMTKEVTEKEDRKNDGPQTRKFMASYALGIIIGNELGNSSLPESSTPGASKETEARYSRSILGGVIRTEIYDRLELAACGAAFVGPDRHEGDSLQNGGTPGEIGGGLSYRFPAQFMGLKPVIGAGYFQQFNLKNSEYSRLDNVGIWLSRATAKSVGIYIGVAFRDGDWMEKAGDRQWVTRFNIPILMKG